MIKPTGRKLFMVSQYGHNQPWKIQLKILEEDRDDFKAVMTSLEFQLFNFAYAREKTMIPFTISAKMMYKDQQVVSIYKQKLTHFINREPSQKRPCWLNGQKITSCPKAATKPWFGISVKGLTLSSALPSIQPTTRVLMWRQKPFLPLVKSKSYDNNSTAVIHINTRINTATYTRYYSIMRVTTAVPDSEAPGAFTQHPSNGLFISIPIETLKEQEVKNY